MFIPLFLICNVRPADRNVTSVVFESDIAYIIIMALFSISNGYVGSICMISGPQVRQLLLLIAPAFCSYCHSHFHSRQMVRGEEASTAAALMVALLGMGLGTGAFISNFLVLLI